MKKEIIKQLKKIDPRFSEKKIFFLEHHLSHAASAFFPSPFQSAIVLTADGVGEWATTSVGIGSKNKLSIKKENKFSKFLRITVFSLYVLHWL